MDATAGEIATDRRATPAKVGRRAIEALLALVVLALLAAAFVGFDASGYWVDELWTLFVVDHSGGAGEVLRRAMTDAHPPLFYLVIHAWIRAFGDGEGAARLFSALCGVAACGVLLSFKDDVLSRPARLFGAAAGASSFIWFKQSQNLRSYTLAMLILTALLGCAVAARRQNRAGEPVSWRVCAAIAGLGLIGAFVHYYLFLVVGLLYLALLAGVPDRRLRATVIASGAAILAAILAYMHLAHSHLLFTQTWFSNDPQALATAFGAAWEQVFGDWTKRALLVLLAGVLYGLWRRRRDAAPQGAAPLGSWIAGVALFVTVGLAAAGLAVSFLMEPSFSARNLLVAAPCAWLLAAWLFDQALGSAPRAGLVFAGLAALLMPLELVALKGRLLNRVEDWRGSAQYVSALPACRGRDIPVVLPPLFLPDSPFARRLAERNFFGRYYRGGGRLIARTTNELATSRDPALVGLLSARASGADPCPVLAWGVHDIHDAEAAELAREIGRRPEVNAQVSVHRIASYRASGEGWRLGWPAAYVFERTTVKRP
jgi:hypothetical protein